MSFLIGLSALWVFWLLLPRRSQKRVRVPLLAIIAITLCFSPPGLGLAYWGLTTWLPVDSGEPVDAIVMLGRGQHLRDLRTAETRHLWSSNRAPAIFVSGMLDARLMVEMLQETGIPSQALSGEECSQSTAENALFSSAILHPKGIRKILLVTDSPHMLRAFLSFRRFGFQPIPHPVSLPDAMSPFQYAAILFREYAGLVSYAVSGQFAPLPAQSLLSPAPPVIAKIHDWNCSVGNS